MFDKEVIVHLKPTDIEVLNGDELIKTASFVLPSDTKYDPDFVYMLVRAVSAGEYYDDNKNGDYFPESELKQYYTTFLKAHVFKNHENKDVMNSIGDVLKATWLDKMKQVELLIRVDRRIAPSVARGIEKGYITDVSMGCRVSHSVCSICGNKAKTQREYCDHIKYMRRQILPDGRKVYEINIRPVFHDISIVLNGAEKVAKIEGIHMPNEKHASQSENMLEKVASYHMPQVPTKKTDFSELINSSREILASYKDDVESHSKTKYLQKVAEIEKQIEGDILNSSLGDVAKQRDKKAENARHVLSLIQGSSLDSKKATEICGALAKIAQQNNKPIYQVFNEFLKVLDFVGIELSPYEFSLFTSKLMPEVKTEQTLIPTPRETAFEDSCMADRICANSDCDGTDIPKAMTAIRILVKKPMGGFDTADEIMPEIKRRMIILSKNTPETPNDSILQNTIMRSAVAPLLAEKSMFPKFVVKRVVALKPKQIYQNPFTHFVRPMGLPDLISRILYEVYQKDRMERLASGETFAGFEKFASYTTDERPDMGVSLGLNKTAGVEKWQYLPNNKTNRGIEPSPYYNFVTASTLGTPIISFLSKYERAKIANGKEVSNIGRMIADSPADVQQFQALFGPSFYNFVRSSAIKTGTGITSSISGLWNGSYSKYGPTPAMLKTASVHAERLNLGKDKQNAIMAALSLRKQKRDDLASEILKKYKISEKDLKMYLQSKKKCYTISLNDKIQKCAETISGDKFLLPSGTESLVGYAALVDFINDNTKNLV